MHLILPPQIESSLTPEEARITFALGLYVSGKLGFGLAAELAGLPRPAFQRHMAQHRVPVNYTVDDLADDAAALGLAAA